MGLKTYEDIVHEALADCAEAGYPQHSISESIYGLSKERDEAVKELEAIKKQEPLCVVENKNLAKLADGKQATVRGCAPHMLYNPHYHLNLFAKPIYQHSFTVDGHTFYADNEVDILYLERKFGVGGKAKLNLVEDK